MTKKESNKSNTVRKLNYSRLIPFILGLMILVIAVIGIIQLIRWNRGQEFIIDENINVDTEPEDFIIFLDPTLLNAEQYDGQLDILILGNDTAAYDKGGTNIGDIIAEQTGANVYNCALTGSYMPAIHSIKELEKHPVDAFSFFWISDSIQSNNWTNQETALTLLSDNYDLNHYTEVLNQLKSIDYNSIDLLLIYYDGHDYLAGHPVNNPFDMYDHHTMEGSFTGSYERYPYNYPNMQHIFITPTFCYVIDENGNKEGCDLADLGYGNLPTGLTTLQTQTQNYSVSYIDNFYGININSETADKYLMEDGITPNKEAREMIGKRIAEFISDRLVKSN